MGFRPGLEVLLDPQRKDGYFTGNGKPFAIEYLVVGE
jgi:hypothetical protein